MICQDEISMEKLMRWIVTAKGDDAKMAALILATSQRIKHNPDINGRVCVAERILRDDSLNDVVKDETTRNLRGVVQDVNKMLDHFLNLRNVEVSNPVIQRDCEDRHDMFETIRRTFRQNNMDVLFLYYTGHGIEQSGDWAIANANGCEGFDDISLSDVIDLWKRTKQHRRSGCQLVIIADSCFSGAWVAEIERKRASNDVVVDDVSMVASCAADETSFETRNGGVFTSYLLRPQEMNQVTDINFQITLSDCLKQAANDEADQDAMEQVEEDNNNEIEIIEEHNAHENSDTNVSPNTCTSCWTSILAMFTGLFCLICRCKNSNDRSDQLEQVHNEQGEDTEGTSTSDAGCCSKDRGLFTQSFCSVCKHCCNNVDDDEDVLHEAEHVQTTRKCRCSGEDDDEDSSSGNCFLSSWFQSLIDNICCACLRRRGGSTLPNEDSSSRESCLSSWFRYIISCACLRRRSDSNSPNNLEEAISHTEHEHGTCTCRIGNITSCLENCTQIVPSCIQHVRSQCNCSVHIQQFHSPCSNVRQNFSCSICTRCIESCAKVPDSIGDGVSEICEKIKNFYKKHQCLIITIGILLCPLFTCLLCTCCCCCCIFHPKECCGCVKILLRD